MRVPLRLTKTLLLPRHAAFEQRCDNQMTIHTGLWWFLMSIGRRRLMSACMVTPIVHPKSTLMVTLTTSASGNAAGGPTTGGNSETGLLTNSRLHTSQFTMTQNRSIVIEWRLWRKHRVVNASHTCSRVQNMGLKTRCRRCFVSHVCNHACMHACSRAAAAEMRV
jgi:hypothetical protein